jgi:hypothetical protein
VAQLSLTLLAPIRMTGEKRSMRQPSANLQEIQVAVELSAAPTVWRPSRERIHDRWPKKVG